MSRSKLYTLLLVFFLISSCTQKQNHIQLPYKKYDIPVFNIKMPDTDRKELAAELPDGLILPGLFYALYDTDGIMAKRGAVLDKAGKEPIDGFVSIRNGLKEDITCRLIVLKDYEQTPFLVEQTSCEYFDFLLPIGNRLNIPVEVAGYTESGLHEIDYIVFMYMNREELDKNFVLQGNGKHSLLIRNIIRVVNDTEKAHVIENKMAYKNSGKITGFYINKTQEFKDWRDETIKRGETFSIYVHFPTYHSKSDNAVLIGFLDFQQIPLHGFSNPLSPCFNLINDQHNFVPVNLTMPAEPGIHELLFVTIPRPYQNIEIDDFADFSARILLNVTN